MLTSKRIVLTTFGTLGDLHPAMALAQELQTRGHHVVIATNKAYRSKVEGVGIAFHPLRPNLPVELGWEWTKLVLDGKIKNKELMDLFCSTQRQTYEDLLKAAQMADLLVSIAKILEARDRIQCENGIWDACDAIEKHMSGYLQSANA